MPDFLKSLPTPLPNWIDGQFVESQAEGAIAVTNPATGGTISSVRLSDASAVELAVRIAQEAFQQWSKRTVKDRAQCLMRFRQLVVQHQDTLSDLIVNEHGKTKQEALAEIAKGNETVEYALGMPQILLGRTQEVSRGVNCSDSRRPLGVVVSIVPFNFPFMVPMWTLPIAIATGNTFILKPSEKVPLTMLYTMQLLQQAGVPKGVVGLVNGTANVATSLIDHPDVSVITFVGTSAIADIVGKRARQLNKRVLALGGAKNHLVAYPDCNVSMAASDIVASFTGCCGQRCMAASVLLVVQPETTDLAFQQTIIGAVVEKASKLVPGQSGQSVMGPVIDSQSLQRVLRFINEAEAGGATILLDGRKWAEPGFLHQTYGLPTGGWWVGPTVILHTNPADRALHEEIFGPVISILVCGSKEEAIQIENSNPYGNAASIYTSTGAVAEWFTKRFSAGMLGVNIGVPVPRDPFSFAGINQSRFGDLDITCDGAVELFTTRIKVTTKWNPPVEKSWLN